MKINLAPMEGVYDAVTRELFTNVGGFDLCATEFVRIVNQLLPPKVYYRYCPELKNGGKTSSGVPVYIQLLGSDVDYMAANAAQAVELGALGIDLNFGCPAKTVNNNGGGSVLLKQPQVLYDIITHVKKAVPAHIPVTAKTRLGYEDKELFLEIAHAVNQAQANSLTVHARTKREAYKPPAHWEYLARMKEVVDIPFYANGDIWSVEDYIRCKKVTGCEDVALGRGAFARPDLAQQIRAHVNGESIQEISADDLLDQYFPDFITQNRIHRDDKIALSKVKQWSKFLGRNYPDIEDFFQNNKRAQELSELQRIKLTAVS